MRCLAVGAHPDDIELGCGGVLLKHVARGDEVHLLVLTLGEKGGEGSVRKREQEAALKQLGGTRLFWGGFPDTQVPDDHRTLEVIEKVVLEVDADIVYLHNGSDTHQDHRAIAQAAISATRRVSTVLMYEFLSTQNFTPSLYVDIEDVIEEKMELVDVHQSQVRRKDRIGQDLKEAVRAMAGMRGYQSHRRYAEAFHVLRMMTEGPLGG